MFLLRRHERPRRTDAVLNDEQFEVLESALACEEGLPEYLRLTRPAPQAERRRLRSVS
ncbi:MAG: hypothetical protein ABJA87_10460 [bacterium]